MMRAPDPASILAAEQRVAECGRMTQARLLGVRDAVRAALARPATLALAAGAAGLLGFWLAYRHRPPAVVSPVAHVAPAASVLGVVAAFALQWGMRNLPSIVAQAWAARQRRISRSSESATRLE